MQSPLGEDHKGQSLPSPPPRKDQGDPASKSVSFGNPTPGALVAAVKAGKLDLVKNLLNAGGQPSERDEGFNATALMLSIEYDAFGQRHRMPLAMVAKCTAEDLAAVDMHGENAFMYAARWGSVRVMEALISKAREKSASIKALVRRNTELLQTDMRGAGLPKTAIELAAQQGHEAMVEMLIGEKGDNGLFGRCEWCDVELAEALVHGCEVRAERMERVPC